MEIIWTEDSDFDISQIFDYIFFESEQSAERVVNKIYADTNYYLDIFPEMGRVGRVQDTREFIVRGTNYIVVYKIENDIIYILSVRHGARLWPSYF
jgi:toxin ParE1/3/4